MNEPGGRPREDDQLLILILAADGKDHAPVRRELRQERLGHVIRRRRHHDSVERLEFRPARITIPDPRVHVAVSQRIEQRPGPPGQLWDDFNRIDVARQLGQDRGLVAGSGPDLEHRVPGRYIQRFGHVRHDVRLRDRLAVADGQRAV